MIDGISISGYRSFGATEVKIADLSRINVFIGKNNCGKSNVLRFVKYLGALLNARGIRQPPPTLDRLDYCLGGTANRITFGLEVRTGPESQSGAYAKIVEAFSGANVTLPADFPKALWFQFGVPGTEPTSEALQQWKDLFGRFLSSQVLLERLTARLCGYTHGGFEKSVADITKKLHLTVIPDREVHLIDAFRRISDSGDNRLSGAGLIKELRGYSRQSCRNMRPAGSDSERSSAS